MTRYWRRVEARADGPAVRSTGTPVAELIGRLEAGESPATLVTALGLEADDLVAALAHEALGAAESGGPPLVQAPPRRPRLAQALTAPALAVLWPRSSPPARLGLSAGLLQIFDFWDESHKAAQEADDLGERAVSAYWHGIAHRREPDPGNAAYWFRRVGRHALFPDLAAAARPLIEAHDPALTERLLPRSVWDPYALIDLCAGGRGQTTSLALALQRLEMIHLLGASLPG